MLWWWWWCHDRNCPRGSPGRPASMSIGSTFSFSISSQSRSFRHLLQNRSRRMSPHPRPSRGWERQCTAPLLDPQYCSDKCRHRSHSQHGSMSVGKCFHATISGSFCNMCLEHRSSWRTFSLSLPSIRKVCRCTLLCNGPQGGLCQHGSTSARNTYLPCMSYRTMMHGTRSRNRMLSLRRPSKGLGSRYTLNR
jgi:hypothetical protein